MIYTMLKTAKLFRNGRSQAVRLPAEYRFEGSEVYVRRDPATGDVILSRRPDSWKEFFSLMNEIEVPENFLADRKNDHSMLMITTPINANVNLAGGTDFQIAMAEALRLRTAAMIATPATSFASGIE